MDETIEILIGKILDFIIRFLRSLSKDISRLKLNFNISGLHFTKK